MTGSSTPWPLRLARLVVRVAAALAPAASGERLRQEWTAELEAESGAAPGWSMVAMAWGAFADARALRAVVASAQGLGAGPRRSGVDALGADVRSAGRVLVRLPGFAATAIGTLALGIGASAAIFTLIDRVILNPLPYPTPSRLVRIQNRVPGVSPKAIWSLSLAQYVYFTDHARTLASVGVYHTVGGNILTATGAERVTGVAGTASLMDLLGIRARAGRVITLADDAPASPPVVLVSESFWRRRLNADPAVVGTSLTYNDTPLVIVGVIAGDVDPPGASRSPDLWLPLRVNRQGPFWNEHAFTGVARLAVGATSATAASEIASLTTEFPRAFPQAYTQEFFDRYGFKTDVLPLKDAVLGNLSSTLWIVFAGVALVLLIACANVTNLFAARVDGRQREMAVRAALGAGRATLARLVLVEGATLACLGGLLAVVVGLWGVPAISALAPTDVPRLHGISIGSHTIVFAFVLSIFTGLAVTAYPAIRAARVRAADGAADGSRSATAGRERQRLRSALVVLEVALALTLAVGAGLLLASLSKIRATDTGVSPAGVLTADVYLSPQRYPTDATVWQAYRGILAQIRALPEVASAGLAEALPVRDSYGCTVQGFEESAVFDRLKATGQTTCGSQTITSPGFFESLGMPILAGRSFLDADNEDPSRAAVVVSESFAKQFWPGENPIGKGVAPNGRLVGPFYRVVGVVGDVVSKGADGAAPLSRRAMAIYYPTRHDPRAPNNNGWWPGEVTLVVRTRLPDPTGALPDVRRAVTAVDSAIPLANITTMEAVIAEASASLAFASVLLETAAVVALLLAAIGLYAVISYVVTRRTREIGTRLAIGATPGQVQRVVILQSLALVTAGLVAGLGLALSTTRLMTSLLVGVSPTNGLVYGLSGLALALIALAASWLPARRASRIDPVMALRAE